MNLFTQSVRTKEAVERIVQAAKEIAPRYDANDQLVALEAVKEKDSDLETVKRLEKIADLIERIANAPANTPHPSMTVGASIAVIVPPTPSTVGKSTRGK
jgi:hypothetical protein